MTQEDKSLLLKDLCGRLPYGVKVNVKGVVYDNRICNLIDIHHGLNTYITVPDGMQYHIESINPYLFPLSSMTEEQKKEISKRYKLHTYYGLCIEITNHSEGYWDDDNSCNLQDYLWSIDWFNKNHFDYRNLIDKNLAIDCTNLNIY